MSGTSQPDRLRAQIAELGLLLSDRPGLADMDQAGTWIIQGFKESA